MATRWSFVTKCCGNLLNPSLAVEPKLLNLEDLVLRSVTHGVDEVVQFPRVGLLIRLHGPIVQPVFQSHPTTKGRFKENHPSF